ncbi:MAG: DUF87 domain-containing protein [Anaerolineaceae bacterium]
MTEKLFPNPANMNPDPPLKSGAASFEEELKQNEIGYVVGGSLKDNLSVRLIVPTQQVQEGGFVVIESGDFQFYGLVTDLRLGSTDPRFADEQMENRLPPGLTGLLHGQTLYTNLEILPALMADRGPEPGSPTYSSWLASHPDGPGKPIAIKTIPSHHSITRLASAGDVADIFGTPGEKGNFIIGTTREQNHPVCIDLEKFVQRSAGIFGATGSGKSFLTRILLAGLIHYNKASVLVFDMHNEYGFDDTASDTNQQVVGLHTKFRGKVHVVGLGAKASIRGNNPDFNLELAEKDIQPSDIELLTRELNLKETTSTTLSALMQSFGPERWYQEFKAMKVGTMVETDEGKRVPAPDSVAAWANEAGINVFAAEGLRSKLGRVFDRPYISPKPAADGIKEIIRSLEAGQHVILSFGEHENDLDYLLVTNLLTRLIRKTWEEKTNQYRSHKGSPEPRPLVIAVEEAHKLLNHEMASQTTFSSIAREMRKVLCHPANHRPAALPDLRRGHVAAWNAHLRLVGR